MSVDLKSRIEHCYRLAENGATELAQAGLQIYVEEFCDSPYKSSLGNPESIFESIEKASHRVGVNVGLQYAEHFYKEGDKNAARGWLYHAKIHAKPLKLDIKENISEIKSKYKDRIPIFF